MRALIGADREPGPVVSLLRRLAFAGAGLEVVHVVAPSDYAIYGVDTYRSPAEVDRIVEQENRAARRQVELVAAQLAPSYTCQTNVLFGHPAQELVQYADLQALDLIAVNAAHAHSEVVAALTGSVARSLVMAARQSVLIARPSLRFHPDEQPLRVVFATDHSPYAERCWDKFLWFAPQNLAQVTVLSAYPQKELAALDDLMPSEGVSVEKAVQSKLLEKNDALIAQAQTRLTGRMPQFDSVVLPQPVGEAIGQTMDAASADLLIVGARGHGTVERLALGSVSLPQALTAPYSVLVLRVSL